MKRPPSLRDRLAAPPVRGLGCAKEVAREAVQDSAILQELIAAVSDSRTVVSRRAANAVRKVQADRPALLAPFASPLVRAALVCEDLQTQWSLTIVVGALPLGTRDRKLAVDLMFEALLSPSGFLRTFAMQALANFAQGDATLKPRVHAVMMKSLEDPSAAVRARARRLLTPM